MPQPIPPPVVIAAVNFLPFSPLNGTGKVGVLITNGLRSFYQVIGANLNRIVSVMWYPKSPTSVQFEMRGLILIDNTQGTFMIRVTENYLNPCNRGGHVAFVLDDSTTITFPTETFGPLSTAPLWTAPDQGLITG